MSLLGVGEIRGTEYLGLCSGKTEKSEIEKLKIFLGDFCLELNRLPNAFYKRYIHI